MQVWQGRGTVALEEKAINPRNASVWPGQHHHQRRHQRLDFRVEPT